MAPPSPRHGRAHTDALAVEIQCPADRYTVHLAAPGSLGELHDVSRNALALTIRRALEQVAAGDAWSLTIDAGPACGTVRFAVRWSPAREVAATGARSVGRVAQWVNIVRPVMLRRARESQTADAHPGKAWAAETRVLDGIAATADRTSASAPSA